MREVLTIAAACMLINNATAAMIAPRDCEAEAAFVFQCGIDFDCVPPEIPKKDCTRSILGIYTYKDADCEKENAAAHLQGKIYMEQCQEQQEVTKEVCSRTGDYISTYCRSKNR